jgi:hypothetical protein
MFSLLLLASVRAEDVIYALENDVPAFVTGQSPSLNPMETVSLNFGVQVALLPKFPPIETGTEGKIQIAEDGFGIALMLGPQVLDIALSQIPEPGLPDAVDTIGFVAAVHSDDAGPTVSFALDFKGVEPLQLCFSDTVMNVAQFVQKLDLEGRRLQEIVPAEDVPGAPTITQNGPTQIITFRKCPECSGEFISDGTTAYAIHQIELALTPPDNEGANREYASAEVTLTGPEPTFAFKVQAIVGGTKGPMFGSAPIHALDLPVPEFCESDAAMKLNVAAITQDMEQEVAVEVGEMDLEDVGDSTARRLTDTKKNLAVHVLKKMNSATEMFKAYKQEKDRLVRMAFIQYSVIAVLALALLFSAGAVARHSFRVQKWDALAANDEEALREGVEAQ